jgi:hypothetical protein
VRRAHCRRYRATTVRWRRQEVAERVRRLLDARDHALHGGGGEADPGYDERQRRERRAHQQAIDGDLNTLVGAVAARRFALGRAQDGMCPSHIRMTKSMAPPTSNAPMGPSINTSRPYTISPGWAVASAVMKVSQGVLSNSPMASRVVVVTHRPPTAPAALLATRPSGGPGG